MIGDVLIRGAGAAGCAAALLLLRQGRTVLLAERSQRGKPPAAPEWISCPGAELLAEIGVDPGTWRGAPFTATVFHDRLLKKEASSLAAEPCGFRIEYHQLTGRMRRLAADAGAEMIGETTRIEHREHHIDAVIGADASRPARLQLCALGTGDVPPNHAAWLAEVILPRCLGDDAMHWVLGPAGGRGLGCWWHNDGTLIARLQLDGSAAETSAGLVDLLRGACERKILPAPAGKVTAAQVRLRPLPARSALELDSHVSKRCLLIGDAGGFVAEVTRESLYPALWSARIAAGTVHEALADPQPQDALRRFSTAWRTDMGAYLRPPNTEMQFLYPLVFANQQMADRLAAAFWRGENI